MAIEQQSEQVKRAIESMGRYNKIQREKNHYSCCHDSVEQDGMFTLVSKFKSTRMGQSTRDI